MAVATAAWVQKMNLCSVFPSPLPCTICHGSLSYCHLTWVLILHSGDVLVVILLSLTNLSQTFPSVCRDVLFTDQSDLWLTRGADLHPDAEQQIQVLTMPGWLQQLLEVEQWVKRCSCHIQGRVHSRCWLVLTTSHEHGDVFVGSCAVSWV